MSTHLPQTKIHEPIWLCATNRETIFIACDTDAESSSSHPLEAVKLLTVNET